MLMRGVAICLVLAHAACLRPSLVDCGEVLCPHTMICDVTAGCIYPQQRDGCEGVADGAVCSYPTVAQGACVDALCVPAACGDGEVLAGEVCDDGNNRNGDGCSADCSSTEVCGNGTVDALGGELCDEGAANGDMPDACRADCRPARCGDGVTDSTEACDDGNTANDDGCSEDCASNEQCGNGTVDPGEQCDEGAANSSVAGSTCRPDCRPGRCGDGIRDPGEACDGTDLDGESCASFDFLAGTLACTPFCAFSFDGCAGTCGDGVRDAGELCDDLDFTLEGQPTTTCTQLGLHPPPPGGSLPCGSDCAPLVAYCDGWCGDGVINGPEACDGTNFENPEDAWCDNGSTSSVACTDCQLDQRPCYCGNGVCDPDEEDGGSAACPGDCIPTCGNGQCESGEGSGEPYECGDCSMCGNAVCEIGEGPGDSWECQGDCATCENGICEAYEGPGEAWACQSDCAVCGNATCETGEGPGEAWECLEDCP